jgi:2-oxoglutarate-Fe(II)-dependent oxygenase superfamily protein
MPTTTLICVRGPAWPRRTIRNRRPSDAMSFVEAHTDHVPKQKLVLSLSLTEQWEESYGGTAVFAWTGLERAVRIPPRLNTAVLFVPFSGSFHWVEQISKNAPAKRRFTWTLFFS